jgi:plastocyanin
VRLLKAVDRFRGKRKTRLSALNRTALEAELRRERVSEYRRLEVSMSSFHGSSVLATILLVGAAVAATAQPVSGGAVIVSDTALTPAVKTIPVGSGVVWTNRGARAHNIASNKGVLPAFAFSLAPASSQRVLFARTGRYPYTEDGSIQGTVIVVAAAGQGTAPGRGTAPGQEATDTASADGCRHPMVYHYDVRVTQSLSIDGQLRAGNGSLIPGNFKLVLDSNAHWLNLPLEVKRCEDHIEFTIAANTSGEFNETESWNDTTQTYVKGLELSPCQVTAAFSTHAGAALGGNYNSRSGIANFSFQTYLYGKGSGHDAVWAQHNFCPVGTGAHFSDANVDIRRRQSDDPHPWFTPSHKGVGGMEFAVEGTYLNLNFRHKTATEIPFPLDVLSAGRDFKFDSGVQTGSYDRGRGEATGNLSTHLTVTFTAVPGG